MASLAKGAERIVLLFCHGGGYHKNTWKPIIRRIQQSPLLQAFPCEYVSVDLRYHGEKYDHSDPGKILYEGDDKTSPRVVHPVREWTKFAPLDIIEQLKEIRAKDDRPTRIVGIGHSMGASTMLNVETTYPQSFDGLVMFEPVCNAKEMKEAAKTVVDAMVSATLAREGEWDNWDSVLKHFTTSKRYRRWHKECLDAFFDGGVIKTSTAFRLALQPIPEASLYCHDVMDFPLDVLANVGCKVDFQFGEHTMMFNPQMAVDAAKKLPDKFLAPTGPIKGTTHVMVVEDPDECARRIVAALAQFPAFQTKSSL
ncbi:hypothetical protein P43SY_001227 [Pythium insidiosum]|uniref:AB hydrolase-1 domain-containing protein n=1 Tax=Pythium insidiosum TaxID=114742 RepID=A0AAD5Q4J2_PYTIN|nr:hypothetical protein P43SY_001227 [Pythium insidiosum]